MDLIEKLGWFQGCLAILALVLIIVFIVTGIGVMLWTGIAVAIFHLPPLTFWQFLGLWLLCHILFGGNNSGIK